MVASVGGLFAALIIARACYSPGSRWPNHNQLTPTDQYLADVAGPLTLNSTGNDVLDFFGANNRRLISPLARWQRSHGRRSLQLLTGVWTSEIAPRSRGR
jgi:hypothetical protein